MSLSDHHSIHHIWRVILQRASARIGQASKRSVAMGYSKQPKLKQYQPGNMKWEIGETSQYEWVSVTDEFAIFDMGDVV